MLRITPCTSLAHARSYFATADYYSEGAELAGIWGGRGAERLGLKDYVTKDAWNALCENLDPNTGERLTVRQKEPRRIGWDFTFSAPKSLSLLHGLTGDQRLVEAFGASVDETMREIESEVQTRVRQKGGSGDRTTGSLVWGRYVHTTSRPVDGVPDPQLHAHCFAFNATWDSAESRWKAAQIGGVKRDAPYFQALFLARLARRMEELGLATRRTRDGWDLAGLDKRTLDKFSRRTALIERRAKDEGITDPDRKAELGAFTREPKAKDLPVEELRRVWSQRMADEEWASLGSVVAQYREGARAEDPVMAREAVEHAAQHCFERSAVVPERMLLAEALRYGAGRSSAASVLEAFKGYGFIAGEQDGRRMVTTREVLGEEQRMIGFARSGRGTRRALGSASHECTDRELSAEQRRAVLHVLISKDRVILVRGAAGTGKTRMMSEAVAAIQNSGKKVLTIAPSADASRGVLRSEGFGDADTVARLLVDEKMQEAARGAVIWVDEAGLLGSRTMAMLFELADRVDARVVLQGDRRQHSAVERGSALRLLETEAGLVPVELKDIRRQRGEYKEAVRALGEGRTHAGFLQLDGLGWVREVEDAERYKVLARDYVETVKRGKSALVISPTHREGERITDEIRAQLRTDGRLGRDERRVLRLVNLNLTEAQRRDSANYRSGDVIVFHQNAKGYTRGQRIVVGKESVPLEHADRYQVFRPAQLAVARGDLLRVTRNGATADGKRLDNGATLSPVVGFTDQGDIRLANGWTVAGDNGHLDHAYCVTSHASQGKTVDRVLIGISEESFPATSQQGLYVSVSRGREQAVVYTDNAYALMDAAVRTEERLTATEFVAGASARERAAILHRLSQLAPAEMQPRHERSRAVVPA